MALRCRYGECKKCQNGRPKDDPAKNGNECADGCGQCKDGECDIDEDKPKPDDQQDPRDCKTLLCGGGHNDKDGETPKDDTDPNDCKTKECIKGESETVKDEFDQRDTICTRQNTSIETHIGGNSAPITKSGEAGP